MKNIKTKLVIIFFRLFPSVVLGYFIGMHFRADWCGSRLRQRSWNEIEEHLQSVKLKPQIYQRTRLSQTKGLIYIGILSMEKHRNTRIPAITDTWGRKHKKYHKIEFFTGNNGTANNPRLGEVIPLDDDIKLIQLPGTADISYPPQKKSFAMLKFIYDNHLNEVNSSKPYYIGRPKQGKPIDSMNPLDIYCVGGSGMLFSRKLLNLIGPHLESCLSEMYSGHEDVEIARCIRRHTGIACSDSNESMDMFYQNYGGKSRKNIYGRNIRNISRKNRTNAISFHANKDPKYQYKLHIGVLQDQIRTLLKTITKSRAAASFINRLL
ncbi:chondroitin sulfate synthase 1-like isoform X2 [Styela clava]